MSTRSWVISLSSWSLIALLAACGGQQQEDPPSENEDPMETTPAPKPEPEPDPRQDEDGDGVLDGAEITPQTIRVNTSGWPGEWVTWEVTSDPSRADTDGDGLSDSDERLYGCDPRSPDTDGDGLSDHDEVVYWSTSPVHVDSDGDSLPAASAFMPAPNPALFDGAELDLRPGEFPEGQPGPHATSPVLTDTDGDAVDDLTEWSLGARSALVADVPSVSFSPTQNTALELAINTVDSFQRSDTTTFSEAADFTEETTLNFHSTVSASIYVDATIDVWEKGKVNVGCCTNFGGGELEVGTRVTSTFRYETSLTAGFGLGVTNNLQRTYTDVLAEARSESVEMTGGRVAMSISVFNDGDVAYEIADIALLMRYRTPDQPSRGARYQTLGELVRGDTLTRCPATTAACRVANSSVLGPGESAQFVMGHNDLPLEPMLDIFRTPDLLDIQLSRFDLRDEFGTDLDFVYRDLPSRTATITLDTEQFKGRYLVAADVHTLADGTQRGVRIADALTAIGLEFGREEVEGETVIIIDGIDTLNHTGDPPDLQEGGADPLGYEHAGDPGPRRLRRGWIAVVTRADPEKEDEYTADFFNARLYPGDILELIVAEDFDRDGIVSVEERIRGTLDGKIHSDGSITNPLGDGLSDYFEMREGWVVETVDSIPYRSFPRADLIDSDGDGLDDFQESPFDGGPGTDPRKADTDDDGYSDLRELTLGNGRFNPLEVDDYTPPTIACTWLAGAGCERVYSVEVNDLGGDIEGFWFDPGDGTEQQWFETNATPGEAYLETFSINHCHQLSQAVDAAKADVTDSMEDTSVASCRRIR